MPPLPYRCLGLFYAIISSTHETQLLEVDRIIEYAEVGYVNLELVVFAR